MKNEGAALTIARSEVKTNHSWEEINSDWYHFNAKGVTGFPFFGRLILDSLNRTETAMTQAHAFKAAELCLRAEAQAVRVAGL